MKDFKAINPKHISNQQSIPQEINNPIKYYQISVNNSRNNEKFQNTQEHSCKSWYVS